MSEVHHPTGTWLQPRSGTLIDHSELMKTLASRQAVLLGETHDRYDIHRWQLHVLAGILAHNQNIVVGFEMFPRHCQPVLDSWVSGHLHTEEFLEKVEWKNVWGFPADLYLPIFHFCRQFAIPMKALNCRRSLVTEVGKLGWDAIAVEDRDGVTPARPATPAHRQYLFEITGGNRPDRKAVTAMDPEFDRFVRAQQTWDRAFACNIAEAHKTPSAPLVIGIIGRGHIEYGYGTPYQLEGLGVTDTAILLPVDRPGQITDEHSTIGDAVFLLPEASDPASKIDRGAN